MPTAEIEKVYNDTEKYINGLEDALLTKHLKNPHATPEEYNLDVKSYCILCHAAFEDYVETITLKVIHHTIENYILHHKISESIVTLMHFKSNNQNYFDCIKDEDPVTSVYDYTRLALKEIKSKFSNEIMIQNHGVSLKYIRQLLMPVAIDIPNNVTMLNSLKLLANERGFFAHKFQEAGVIKKSIEPEKAKTTIKDCLDLCQDLRDKAKLKVV